MDTPQCGASFLSLLLLFLLVSCSLPSLISASSFCNPSDRRALWKIKKSLNIPHYFDSWNPWKLSIDCCSWNHVDCNTAGRVTQLSFYTIHAPFHIPEAIGDLPYLNYLVFKDITNFTGSIPYSITKLHDLEFLEIQNTSLSGPIPEFLGQLKNLNSLFLGYNQLSGPLPDSLGNLNRLEVLDVRSNKLTGSIPDSFGGFNNDFEDGFFLFLSYNQLSGKVPKSLNISKVDLSYNKLSDASEWLREDGAARYIDLSHNQLDFDLTKVRFPRSIEVLHMSHNKIHGSIPEQVTEVNVQLLDLSYNRLCGKIPVGGNVQDMGAKAFAHNRCLCGPPLPNKCK